MTYTDAINAIVDHVDDVTPESLPVAAVTSAKSAILDALGTTIAGANQPGVPETLSVLRRITGRPESRVAIHGDHLGATDAAIANILMCHALEIDDAHYPAIVHPTAPSFWTAVATAEAIGGVSGSQLLCAVALATDVMCRLALGAPRTIDNGYHTALFSIFGGVVASAKLRNVSREILHNAFGIALCRAAASVQAGTDGALFKRLQPSLNAAEGMRAVLFAEAGISGPRRVLEGSAGLFQLFNHDSGHVRETLNGLGERFLGTELSTKLYPSSRCGHGPIEATLALAAAHDIDPSSIDEILVDVQESCFRRESHGYDPHKGNSQVSAQFSIDYGVAAALLWREVFIDQYKTEATQDPHLIALTKRVKIRRNEHQIGATPYVPVTVTIRIQSGISFSHTVFQLNGSPQSPLSWDDIIQKRWRRCAETHDYFAKPEVQERIVEAVDKLDRGPNAETLLDLMIPER